MKTIFSLVVATALWSPSLNAQVSLPIATSGPVAVDAGPHHRTWQNVKIQLNEQGQQVATTNSYVELATGMNVWSETEGTWLPASDEIELVNGGAIAARTQHKVIFLPNLNDRQPPIDLFLPDGNRLRSQIVGLAYTERDTGRSVFISELKDSVGQVVGRNQVIYPDAFESIKADVRYTVTPSYFEQDVILREQIPSPAELGLNPITARLEVWTEFFDQPEPEQSTGVIPRNNGEADRDDALNFGAMRMIGGKSFSLDGELTAGGLEPLRGNGLQNAKEWQVINGMTFLIESVPYIDVRASVDALPARTVAWKIDAKSKERLAANPQPGKRQKPISVAQSSAEPRSASPTHQPARMVAANAPARQPGVLLDYILINSTQTNFVFKSDTTYYATNYVALYGTTTLEGGAVAKGIKWDGGAATGTFIVYGAFDCRTSPYRPAIFTAVDDDTAGDVITGVSTGTPTNIYRGSLWFDTTNSVVLENIRVRYAVSGCSLKTVPSPTLRHMQFVSCDTALERFSGDCSFQNILIHKGFKAIQGYSATNMTAEHLTIDGTTWAFYSVTNGTYPTPSTLTVTNSLLVGVSSTYSFTGGSNATNSSASATFQAVGAGNNYLLPNSQYRNVGTTNITPKLLADLKLRTTYPPIVLSNDFTVPTTLAPQAQRDTDTPDLGYHFDPLDFCWNNLNLNTTLTLTNGVAVAIYGTNGLALQSGAMLLSEGSPTSLNQGTIEVYRCVAAGGFERKAALDSSRRFPARHLERDRLAVARRACRCLFDQRHGNDCRVHEQPGGTIRPFLLSGEHFRLLPAHAESVQQPVPEQHRRLELQGYFNRLDGEGQSVRQRDLERRHVHHHQLEQRLPRNDSTCGRRQQQDADHDRLQVWSARKILLPGFGNQLVYLDRRRQPIGGPGGPVSLHIDHQSGQGNQLDRRYWLSLCRVMAQR